MPQRKLLPPAALLTLSLLSGCAAAAPDPVGAAIAARPAPGASGAFLVARNAMAHTDYATATTEYMQALAASPDDTGLRQQAFMAAALTGRPDAVRLAQQLPYNIVATLLLADRDVKAGAWADAEAKFASLPDQGLTQALQPLVRAWAQQGAGSTDQALATLRPYIDSDRYRGVFELHAAMISDQAGRSADAGRLYRQAVIDHGGLNLRLGMIAASWQARSGHPEEARMTIQAMADASPDLQIAGPALNLAAARPEVPGAADGVAEAYLALAAALQRADTGAFSPMLLRLALDLRPGFTAARLLAADMQAGSGQMAAALAMLAAVPSDDPLITVVRLRQAKLQERLGHTAEARQILEQMALDYPQRSEPLMQLAGLQVDHGAFAEAAQTYGRAIGRGGAPGQAEWALYYQRGIAYDRAHDWPHAEADLLHALALSPDQPYVLNYLGYSWAEQGRNLPRAREMIERALALRPNDGAVMDSLGLVMLLQGNRTGAVHLLEQAVERTPEDSTVNAHLGDAYAASGRRQEALTQWRRALILNPEPQDAVKLQAKLAAPDAGPNTALPRVE